jgi:vitamin B12 transporter
MEITTGIHFQSQGVLDKSTTVPNPQDAVFSPYSTLLFRTSERWNAELGIRYNHHSKFGSNFNYSLASTYWIQDELKLFANYTTGFKAPNLFQLYGAFGANPNLNPLISKAFEVGIAWQVDASMLYGEMAYFRRNVDQIIVFDFNAGYLNQDEQNDQGIEFSVGICPVDQLKMNIQYTFLDGTTVSVGPNGESIESDNLFKRPDHQIEGMIEYSFNKSWNFGITASWSNERPDLFFNPNNFFTPEIVVLEPFLYLTVNANYTISKNLKAYMTIKNLSNASFSEVYGFGTPGINYSLGMNFTLSR